MKVSRRGCDGLSGFHSCLDNPKRGDEYRCSIEGPRYNRGSQREELRKNGELKIVKVTRTECDFVWMAMREERWNGEEETGGAGGERGALWV